MTSAIRPPADGRPVPTPPFFTILGSSQDGGYPQPGCRGPCCAAAWADPARGRLVASAAIVVGDPAGGAPRRWLIDATPDLGAQLHMLDRMAPPERDAAPPALAGILLTHGHVGHVLGLTFLGREIMAAREVPVYAMPGLLARLAGEPPWRSLVDEGRIVLRPLLDHGPVHLGDRVIALPERVPHRADAGETVGFRIAGPARTVLYLPDIDSWDATLDNAPTPGLAARLANIDVAYLDGTFFDDSELPGRDRTSIPHPTITDTLKRIADFANEPHAAIRFTHLNHSNPALDPAGSARATVKSAGTAIAADGEWFSL